MWNREGEALLEQIPIQFKGESSCRAATPLSLCLLMGYRVEATFFVIKGNIRADMRHFADVNTRRAVEKARLTTAGSQQHLSFLSAYE